MPRLTETERSIAALSLEDLVARLDAAEAPSAALRAWMEDAAAESVENIAQAPSARGDRATSPDLCARFGLDIDEARALRSMMDLADLSLGPAPASETAARGVAASTSQNALAQWLRTLGPAPAAAIVDGRLTLAFDQAATDRLRFVLEASPPEPASADARLAAGAAAVAQALSAGAAAALIN